MPKKTPPNDRTLEEQKEQLETVRRIHQAVVKTLKKSIHNLQLNRPLRVGGLIRLPPAADLPSSREAALALINERLHAHDRKLNDAVAAATRATQDIEAMDVEAIQTSDFIEAVSGDHVIVWSVPRRDA